MRFELGVDVYEGLSVTLYGLSPSSGLEMQIVDPKRRYLPTSTHGLATQKTNIDHLFLTVLVTVLKYALLTALPLV
jgi:hypothetical protein